jgi:hypothetical protein
VDETGTVLCPIGSFGIKSVESIGSATTVLDRCQTNSHTDEEKDKTAIFDMTLK